MYLRLTTVHVVDGGGRGQGPSRRFQFKRPMPAFDRDTFPEHNLAQVYIVTHTSRIQIAKLSLAWYHLHATLDYRRPLETKASASCPVQVCFFHSRRPLSIVYGSSHDFPHLLPRSGEIRVLYLTIHGATVQWHPSGANQLLLLARNARPVRRCTTRMGSPTPSDASRPIFAISCVR